VKSQAFKGPSAYRSRHSFTRERRKKDALQTDQIRMKEKGGFCCGYSKPLVGFREEQKLMISLTELKNRKRGKEKNARGKRQH